MSELKISWESNAIPSDRLQCRSVECKSESTSTIRFPRLEGEGTPACKCKKPQNPCVTRVFRWVRRAAILRGWAPRQSPVRLRECSRRGRTHGRERRPAPLGAYTYSSIPPALPRRDSGAAPPHHMHVRAGEPTACGVPPRGGPERAPPPPPQPLCPCRRRPTGTGSAPLLLPGAGGGQPAPPPLSPPRPPPAWPAGGEGGLGSGCGWVQRRRVFWQQGRAPRRRVAGSSLLFVLL